MSFNLAAILRESARSHPDKVAVISGKHRMTFAELDATSDRFAEAAVVGVPDERLGQEVKAFVALRPGLRATEAELIEYVKERIASYKYPRSVEFRDALPMNAAGKVQKREL